MWKLVAREIGIVLVCGAAKAFAGYMEKQKPKQILALIAHSVKSEKIPNDASA